MPSVSSSWRIPLKILVCFFLLFASLAAQLFLFFFKGFSVAMALLFILGLSFLTFLHREISLYIDCLFLISDWFLLRIFFTHSPARDRFYAMYVAFLYFLKLLAFNLGLISFLINVLWVASKLERDIGLRVTEWTWRYWLSFPFSFEDFKIILIFLPELLKFHGHKFLPLVFVHLEWVILQNLLLYFGYFIPVLPLRVLNHSGFWCSPYRCSLFSR